MFSATAIPTISAPGFAGHTNAHNTPLHRLRTHPHLIPAARPYDLHTGLDRITHHRLHPHDGAASVARADERTETLLCTCGLFGLREGSDGLAGSRAWW
ncbi:hypothetical protein DENSPDRAFT_838311 [Dentipellis sp. KUC8613]|nr:hypothetical protein DENSPDRAFT_838311 [Dentipellis sp. KUC8613]